MALDYSTIVGALIGIVGTVVAFRAWSRRRIAVWFSGQQFIAAPRDDLELGVTHRGQAIDLPVYLVQLELKCAGNRDVAMEAVSEYIQVDAGDGIEFVTVRYGPNELKLEVVESTNKTQKFRFDLLKRSQAIYLSLYVKSARDFKSAILADRFPVKVHIKDVQKTTLATNRLENAAGLVALFLMVALYGGNWLLNQMQPVPVERLLTDADDRLVTLDAIEGSRIQVCEATSDMWDTAKCTPMTAAEVAELKPAAPPTYNVYANDVPFWQRVVGSVIIFLGAVVFVFGRELLNLVARLIERWKKK